MDNNIDLARRPLQEPKKEDYPTFPIPSSPPITTGRDILIAATNRSNPDSRQDNTALRLANFALEEPLISHSHKLTVRGEGSERRVTYKSNKADFTYSIDNIKQLNGQSEVFYDFLLMKAQEQFYNGEIINNRLYFDLQELIDIGMYSDIKSARRGAFTHIATIEQLKIQGEVSKVKDKEYPISPGSKVKRQLFKDEAIVNNVFSVEMNQEINWNTIFQYFTILPIYAFSLYPVAHNLLEYIFEMARQNCKELANNNGSFNISLKAIQHRLQLPKEFTKVTLEDGTKIEKPTRNARQHILKPIGKAIDAIETAHSDTYHNTDLALMVKIKNASGEEEDLEITNPSKYSTATILRNGYLEITLKGKLAEKYIYINKLTGKQIKAYYKAQEKAASKA